MNAIAHQLHIDKPYTFAELNRFPKYSKRHEGDNRGHVPNFKKDKSYTRIGQAKNLDRKNRQMRLASWARPAV